MCFCSFVVPVHNVMPEYLRQCLDSILYEKDIPIEVILVDDASSNGCEKLCDEYQKEDARVKVHHLQQNQGVSKARNTGVELSNGEWIIFVDSDDWIETTTCKRLLEEVSDEADVMIFSAYRECVSGSRPFGTTDKRIVYGINGNEYRIADLCDKLIKQKLRTTHPMYDTIKYCWGKAYRREFIIAHSILFQSMDYCEDIVYAAEIFKNAKMVIQLPDRFYHYRMSLTSTVNSYRTNIISEQRKFLSAFGERCIVQDAVYYAALLSMEICITRFLFHPQNHTGLIKKHLIANQCFAEQPYIDVFKYVDLSAMKKVEKWKAILIKYRLYYLYYLCTEARKRKTVSYQ